MPKRENLFDHLVAFYFRNDHDRLLSGDVDVDGICDWALSSGQGIDKLNEKLYAKYGEDLDSFLINAAMPMDMDMDDEEDEDDHHHDNNNHDPSILSHSATLDRPVMKRNARRRPTHQVKFDANATETDQLDHQLGNVVLEPPQQQQQQHHKFGVGFDESVLHEMQDHKLRVQSGVFDATTTGEEVCSKFRLDTESPTFGMCRCGHDRQAHVKRMSIGGKGELGTALKQRRESMNPGAMVIPPSPPPTPPPPPVVVETKKPVVAAAVVAEAPKKPVVTAVEAPKVVVKPPPAMVKGPTPPPIGVAKTPSPPPPPPAPASSHPTTVPNFKPKQAVEAVKQSFIPKPPGKFTMQQQSKPPPPVVVVVAPAAPAPPPQAPIKSLDCFKSHFQLDMNATEFGICVHCKRKKADHLPDPKPAATPAARPQSIKLNGPPEPCAKYQLDLVADTFGACVCGFAKQAHQGGGSATSTPKHSVSNTLEKRWGNFKEVL